MVGQYVDVVHALKCQMEAEDMGDAVLRHGLVRLPGLTTTDVMTAVTEVTTPGTAHDVAVAGT